MLPVSEKVKITEKADAQLHMTRIVTEQFGISLSMLNNIMAHRKTILQQCTSVMTQPDRNMLKTKYDETESVLL